MEILCRKYYELIIIIVIHVWVKWTSLRVGTWVSLYVNTGFIGEKILVCQRPLCIVRFSILFCIWHVTLYFTTSMYCVSKSSANLQAHIVLEHCALCSKKKENCRRVTSIYRAIVWKEGNQRQWAKWHTFLFLLHTFQKSKKIFTNIGFKKTKHTFEYGAFQVRILCYECWKVALKCCMVPSLFMLWWHDHAPCQIFLWHGLS